MPKKTKKNIKATKKQCAIFVSNKHLLEILLVGNLQITGQFIQKEDR